VRHLKKEYWTIQESRSRYREWKRGNKGFCQTLASDVAVLVVRLASIAETGIQKLICNPTAICGDAFLTFRKAAKATETDWKHYRLRFGCSVSLLPDNAAREKLEEQEVDGKEHFAKLKCAANRLGPG
jgi:hypothetical protein